MKELLKSLFRKIGRKKLLHVQIILYQFGLDPVKGVRAILGLPRFLRDWFVFKRLYRGKVSLWPCLTDRYEEAGVIKNEYFWQDLYVAQKIYDASPNKHVDVGSRLDGFVAHLASFREVEMIDIRPLHVRIPRIQFRQVDIMNLPEDMIEYSDSVSCLHALEHVGLGRYGDTIDPNGWQKAFENLGRLLKQGGRLYLSVPCGRERVEFNALRVFDPLRILTLADSNSLALEEIALIHPEAGIYEVSASKLEELVKEEYILVLFVFLKQ